MKINIKTTNMDLTDPLTAYIHEKITSVEKFMMPHEGEEPLVQVEVGQTTKHHQSGDIFRAEANLSVRGNYFRAVSEKDDLYAALDEMRDGLVRELTSKKEKERTLMRKGAGILKNLLRFGRAK